MTFAFTHRDRLIPALGLVAVDLAAIGLLPHLWSTVAGEVALLTLAFIHTAAFVRWSGPLTGIGRPTPTSPLP